MVRGFKREKSAMCNRVLSTIMIGRLSLQKGVRAYTKLIGPFLKSNFSCGLRHT